MLIKSVFTLSGRVCFKPYLLPDLCRVRASICVENLASLPSFKGHWEVTITAGYRVVRQWW